MIRQFSKAAALTAAAFLTCAAAAAPVVIDSEQKANAAVVAAQRALSQPKSNFLNMSHYARSVAEKALRKLAAGTTPIALINSRNGITLPCATSGTLTARMARTFPRVLKLQWQSCAFIDLDDYPHVHNGSAEIILLSDSFVPGKVAGIRLGTATSDFTDSRHIGDDPEQITDELNSLNLRMVGQIPMVRAFPLYGYFVGEFAFEMTGFIQWYFRAELPGTGQPPYEQTSRMSMEFLIASGATTYDSTKTHLDDELRLHYGKVTHTTVNPPPYGETSQSYRVEGLKIREISDFVAWSGSRSVDGKIELQYSPQSGNCLSGAYTFKTRVPLMSNSLYSNQFNAGELSINGSATAKFFSPSNVPPTLPVPQLGMLIQLDVRNVGSFNYDAADLSVLAQNAQCFGW